MTLRRQEAKQFKHYQALALHLDGLAQDGEPVPEPSSLAAIMTVAEHRDGVAVLVPVKGRASKIVRVNITIPKDVLARSTLTPKATA